MHTASRIQHLPEQGSWKGMRLTVHLAIGLAQSADAFADVVDTHITVGKAQEMPKVGIWETNATGTDFDTVRDPAFDELLRRDARRQFGPQKIPAFGTPHLCVWNFHGERVDHRIPVLTHLIGHFNYMKLYLV